MHLPRGGLQHGAQGLLQAELGWLLLLLGLGLRLRLLRAGQGQRAGAGVRALGYLHLVKVGLQLGLLLQEQPLLVQPACRTEKQLFLAIWTPKGSLARSKKSLGNPAQ